MQKFKKKSRNRFFQTVTSSGLLNANHCLPFYAIVVTFQLQSSLVMPVLYVLRKTDVHETGLVKYGITKDLLNKHFIFIDLVHIGIL